MQDEIELLKKRFLELSRKASDGSYFTYTDFLGLSELSALSSVKNQLQSEVRLFGGAMGAERVVARFGSVEDIGYDAEFPIKALEILPRDKKFAEKLSHRDYLGALLNLGIERSTLGDIVITPERTYLFALEDMAEYITTSLERVRRTDVIVKEADSLPEGELYKTEMRRITVESERIDAVIAKIYNLSRQDAQALIKRSLVFVDGRECTSNSYKPKPDEKISVRGHGRLIFRGVSGTTKRDRLALMIEVYI